MTRDVTRHIDRLRSDLTRAAETIRSLAGSESDGRDDAVTTGSAELHRAIGFLGWRLDAVWVVKTGYRAGAVAGGFAFVLVAVLAGPLVGLVGGAALGLAATHAIHRAPVWLATLQRTRALGAAPGLVGRLVLCMRLDPSTERAVRFAARTGRGPLARALARHERRSVNAPTSGLRSFAHEWREWFPAIERASTLLRTAAAAPPARRGRALDRALEATITGTTERLAAFVGAVEGPVSALYAFGVLVPLAFVALLPAAAASGVPLPVPIIAGVYLVVLPTALVAAGAWLLAKRPVAFPPPQIDADHPAVPDRRLHAIVAGALTATVAGVATTVGVARWAAPVGAAGVGIGAALLVATRPRRVVLARVNETESGLPDAMTIIGGAVAEGVAVERAVASAGDRLTGATGELFSRAGRRSDALRVDVREAFLGDGGPATTVPSPRVQGAVALLAIAAREGRPAGDVVLELADQLERLRELERDARRQLATVTGTLSNTAAVFAPLVGGATVALATGIDATGVDGLQSLSAGGVDGGGLAAFTPAAPASEGEGARPLSVPVLGQIVGTYTLVLAVILTGLSTGLERGFDATLVAYRVGIALPTATVTYLIAFVAAGLLW